MIEDRVGHGSQQHNFFIRMLDKNSFWNNQDGLKTMIPTLLHFGEKIFALSLCFTEAVDKRNNTTFRKKTIHYRLYFIQACSVILSSFRT